MNDKHRIIELILNNHGKTNEELFELDKRNSTTKEQFEETLKSVGLGSIIDRTNFYWHLQLAVEKTIYEYPGRDNPVIAEMVVEDWNKGERVLLTPQLVISFLTPLQFKFTYTQKAFLAVCDGDLDSYKAYVKNPKLFVELFIRFGMCTAHRMSDLIDVAKVLMFKIFGSSYERNELFEALKRLDFLIRKDGKINYRKMTVYKRVVGSNSLVFADGMKMILTKYVHLLEPTLASKLEQFLTDKLESGLTDSTEGEREDSLNEMSQHDGTNPVKPIAEVTLMNKSSEGEDTNQENTPIPSLETALIIALTEIGEIVDQAKKTAGIEEKQTPPLTQVSDQYVRTLEEENQRLKVAFEQEQSKAALAEEKAMVQILTTVAGKTSNYLLSELFDESDGNLPENRMISKGRLVNFFSALTLLGIEPHTHYYEKGQIFTIHKDELIKNFMIDSSISTKEENIKVQLIRYGWTLNGKIIIQPLVIEVKGE